MSALPALADPVPSHDAWRARLALRFAHDGARSRLVSRQHEGPLVVQKPLYAEGGHVCQCIVVHPPGGVAGGDTLAIEVDVGAGAWAQITTPGAAKWYRAAGRRAAQDVRVRVEAGATFEWLPQSTIVFDGVDGTSAMRVDLATDSVYLGWDVVCLGRTASSECFTDGRWRQRVDIVRDHALLWSERTALAGGDQLLLSPVGLNGAPVFGTFAAMAPRIDDDLIAMCRGFTPSRGDGAITRVPHALVARYVGDSTEAAHDYFRTLWHAVRPALAGRPAVPLRIWNT
jgi:urease accessory protein